MKTSVKIRRCRSDEFGKHGGVLIERDESLVCEEHDVLQDIVEQKLAEVNERELGEFSRQDYEEALHLVSIYRWVTADKVLERMKRNLVNEARLRTQPRVRVNRRHVRRERQRDISDANLERIVTLGFAIAAA